MKKTFRLFLFILLAASCLTAFSQGDGIYKYKTVHVSFGSVKDGKIVTPFNKELDDTVLIVLNFKKNKVDIYSPREQHLDIVKYDEPDKSNPTLTMYHYETVDSDGDKCDTFAIITKGKDEPDQLWVRYPDTVMVYTMIMQKD
jgi:hypothetical protein